MRSSSPAPIARRQPSPPPGRESGSRSSNPPILFRANQFPISVARAFSQIISRPTINLEEMLQAEREAIVEVGTERDLGKLRECRTNILRFLPPRERAAYRAFLLVITAAYVRRDQFIEAQNTLGALLIYDRQDPVVAWVSNALKATKDAIQTAKQTPGIDPAQLSSQLEPALVLPENIENEDGVVNFYQAIVRAAARGLCRTELPLAAIFQPFFSRDEGYSELVLKTEHEKRFCPIEVLAVAEGLTGRPGTTLAAINEAAAPYYAGNNGLMESYFLRSRLALVAAEEAASGDPADRAGAIIQALGEGSILNSPRSAGQEFLTLYGQAAEIHRPELRESALETIKEQLESPDHFYTTALFASAIHGLDEPFGKEIEQLINTALERPAVFDRASRTLKALVEKATNATIERAKAFQAASLRPKKAIGRAQELKIPAMLPFAQAAGIDEQEVAFFDCVFSMLPTSEQTMGMYKTLRATAFPFAANFDTFCLRLLFIATRADKNLLKVWANFANRPETNALLKMAYAQEAIKGSEPASATRVLESIFEETPLHPLIHMEAAHLLHVIKMFSIGATVTKNRLLREEHEKLALDSAVMMGLLERVYQLNAQIAEGSLARPFADNILQSTNINTFTAFKHINKKDPQKALEYSRSVRDVLVRVLGPALGGIMHQLIFQ